MAKGSQKRVAAGNAAALRTLAVGFVLVNTIHLVLTFGVYKITGWKPVALYVSTEALAAALAVVLVRTAASGQDLAQEGLTTYMFDIIYVTWFVHVTTAVVSRYFWWAYLVIPVYAVYAEYTKIIGPYVFKGNSPFSMRPGNAPAQPVPAAEPAMSKRQSKAQKRGQRGRVQMRH